MTPMYTPALYGSEYTSTTSCDILHIDALLWQKNKAVKKNTFTPGIDCIAHTRLLSIEHTHLLENACPQLDMRAITHPRLCLCSCYQAWICQKWKKKYMDRDVVNMNIHFICWGYLLWIMKANEGGFTDVK